MEACDDSILCLWSPRYENCEFQKFVLTNRSVSPNFVHHEIQANFDGNFLSYSLGSKFKPFYFSS